MITRYEVIDKETTEVFPVTSLRFDDKIVEATTVMGIIIFNNPGEQGVLSNDKYLIQEVASPNE